MRDRFLGIQDSRHGLMRDKRGREIRPGDLLRTYHFTDNRQRKHWLYHTVTLIRSGGLYYFKMVPTAHLEPLLANDGGSCLLTPELAREAIILAGYGPGDLCYDERPIVLPPAGRTEEPVEQERPLPSAIINQRNEIVDGPHYQLISAAGLSDYALAVLQAVVDCGGNLEGFSTYPRYIAVRQEFIRRGRYPVDHFPRAMALLTGRGYLAYKPRTMQFAGGYYLTEKGMTVPGRIPSGFVPAL